MSSVREMPLLLFRQATLGCALLACLPAPAACAQGPQRDAAATPQAGGSAPSSAAGGPQIPKGGLRLDVTVVDENGVPVANARITVVDVQTQQVKLTETDSAGRLRLTLPPGMYLLTVDRTGFYTFTAPPVNPQATNAMEITVHHHQPVGETVTVTDVAPGIDPQQTSRRDTLNSRDIVNIPYPTTRDVRKVLTYMPGLVQDPVSNQVHIAGAAAYQSDYVLDGFLMNQPVTGNFDLRVSPDAVRRIDVEASRYSAQYGRASGGVLVMDTRTGDNAYRFSVTNFFPTFQMTRGFALNNWVPRATFSGPLKKDRAWFYLSQDAEVDNIIVKQLPANADRNLLWRVGDLAKVQFNLTPGNVLSTSFVYNYLDSPHSGINRFNPLEATTNQQNTAWMYTLRDQITMAKEMLLDFGIAVTEFRDSLRPQGTADFIVNPTTVAGNYFRTTLAHARRVQGTANLYLPPVQWMGRHDLRVGLDESAVDSREDTQRRPTLVYDTNNQLIRKITFTSFGPFSRTNVETGAWAEDRWAPFDRLIIEAGIRADRDQIVPHTDVSPRIAGSYTIGKKEHTKFSAGVGEFYDETRLNFINRPLQGERFDYFYAKNGTTQVGPTAVTVFNVNQSALFSPRFLNWSLGMERMLPGRIYSKLEYTDRHGVDVFSFVNQGANPAGPGGNFLLTNKRADHYNGFTVTVRRDFANNHAIFASYTHSKARTNEALEFTLDNPIFGQQQRGPLPWDSPNRFIAWGWLPLNSRWIPTHFLRTSDFAFSMEYRTGFPYVIVNHEQALVGRPYRARFPSYVTVNPAIEHIFEFLGYQFAIRGGIDNITGNQNPVAVVNNIDSPLFGTFSGTGHRTFNGRIRFLGKK